MSDEVASLLKSLSLVTVPDDEVSPVVRNVIDEFKSSKSFLWRIYGSKKGSSPIFLVADSPAFQAAASSLKKCDVIIIFSGVEPILDSICSALLSSKSLFPAMGPVPDTVSESIYSPSDCVEKVYFPSAQLSGDRKVLKDKLVFLILYCMLAHETTHIMNGHLDLFQARSGERCLMEFGPSSKNVTSLERQTLEWDADVGAAEMMLRFALDPEITTVSGRSKWTIKPLGRFGDADTSIHMALAATTILALVLTMSKGSEESYGDDHSHPHGVHRGHHAHVALEHFLSFRTGFNRRDSSDQRLFNSVIEAWYQVFYQYLDESFSPAWSVDGLRRAAGRFEEYKKQWSILHPDLQAHSRGVTIAPASPQVHPAHPQSGILG
ncbi:hypothetical protein [Sphingomonas morindae]|uniref:Peptidase M48 domain-containing protein n=1 Tax=Sphingomonas morindae TaxID=1541170 RepID=A0ABY4X7S4_9SPHN|nr:hypothetical protein [Sphingomonas morindae]USI72695.1 hypothetical protein LHA26_15695 [Sphingomonas morindae]